MLDAIAKYARNCEGKICAENIGDSFVCVVVTPFMHRVHHLQQAGEIVFMDTTSHIDQTNCAFTVLLCQSCFGALPLGVIISSKQDEKSYHEGFCILQRMLGEDAFCGSTPQTFMTDDSSAEKNAIARVWPNATQLLCTFHVLQAVWRWLLDSKHKIPKDLRPSLLQDFKSILHSTSEEHTHNSYDKLMAHCQQAEMHAFMRYVDQLMQRKTEWCMAYRLHLLTRGSHTNNMCEATIRIVKDIVFNRCKAYNPCEVLHLAVEVFSPYLQGRIINILYGKTPKHVRNRELIPKEAIRQLSGAQYEVRSRSEEGVMYTVDIDCGSCSCYVGLCGAMCKHQYSTIVHFMLTSNNHFGGSPEEKYKWACIALGEERAPKLPFFQSMLATDNTLPHVAGNNEQETTFIARPDNAEITEETPSTSQSVQQQHSERNSKDINAKNVELFHEVTTLLKKHIDFDSENATQALEKYRYTLQRVKTSEQMHSCLHNFSGLAARTFGRKIRVQPTAIARRRAGVPRGSAPLRQGRPPLALGPPPAKRKRNLSYNVLQNQANAKSH